MGRTRRSGMPPANPNLDAIRKKLKCVSYADGIERSRYDWNGVAKSEEKTLT